VNQPTENPTKHALIMMEINDTSAGRTHPAQLPNAHLLFLALLGGRLIRHRRRTRLPSRDALRRDDRCPRHRGKLHRLECRLLGELDIPVEIGMRGCNPFTVLIQKNHGSMVWVVAVGRGVGVSAIHVSGTRTSIQGGYTSVLHYLRADNASPQPGDFIDGALDLLDQPADVDGCSLEGPVELLQLSGGA
jgi:hypothetical protein